MTSTCRSAPQNRNKSLTPDRLPLFAQTGTNERCLDSHLLCSVEASIPCPRRIRALKTLRIKSQVETMAFHRFGSRHRKERCSRRIRQDCCQRERKQFGEVWRNLAKFDKHRTETICRQLILNEIGSSGRTRTYNPSVNRRSTHLGEPLQSMT
jgi:hypothetical protein